MTEITFIVTEDDIDGGYSAKARWSAGNRDIYTQGANREDLITNVKEAVEVSFGEEEARPTLIHLHFVRDEVIAI